MTANQRIKEEIREKLDKLSSEKLQEVLEFLESLEDASPQTQKILSYAGIWKDMDPALFEDLTTNLHKNRVASSRAIDVE
ncbi:MAG: DUF2281 domain-containing protein [Phaeodactylibacter sp.]|nr:DUF2281 domain-containing protein [Phaeodactylibacter sp.]